jgi:hypothetical protein
MRKVFTFILFIAFCFLLYKTYPILMMKYKFWTSDHNFIHKQTKTASIKDFVKDYDDAYSLKPDKRILSAVSEIHSFFTKEPKIEPELLLVNNAWFVKYRGKIVGELPVYPDFVAQLKLLEVWTKRLNENNPQVIGSVADKFETKELSLIPKELFAHLEKISDSWDGSQEKGGLLFEAAQAYAYLSFVVLDRMSLAEDLVVKALAYTAITKSVTKQDTNHIEVLLANRLDFSSSSKELAKDLPKEDSLKAYVLLQDDQLELMASSPKADLFEKYLWLLRLGENHDYEGWLKWAKKIFKEPKTKFLFFYSGITFDSFNMSKALAQTLPIVFGLEFSNPEQAEETTKDIMNGFFEKKRPSLERLLEITTYLEKVYGGNFSLITNDFESKLTAFEGINQKIFLNSQTRTNFWRAYYYSCLQQLGFFYLYTKSSDVEALHYVSQLKDITAPQGIEFYQWLDLLIRIEQKKIDLNKLSSNSEKKLKGVLSYKYLGPLAVQSITRALSKQLDYGNPQFTLLGRGVFATLDSRIANRSYLRYFVQNGLYDVALTEALLKSVAMLSGDKYPRQKAYYDYFQRDEKALLEAVNSHQLTVDQKKQVLSYAQKIDGIDKKPVEKAYEAVIKEHPHNWGLYEKYAKMLMKEEKFAQARQVAKRWLKEKVRTDSLEKYYALTLIGQTYLKEKKYKKGYQEIYPALPGGVLWTFRVAAELLEKQGHIEDAQKIYETAFLRYRRSEDAVVDLVAFYWRQSLFDKAAAILKKGEGAVHAANWQHLVGKKFLETFSKDKKVEAEEAFAALVSQNIDAFKLIGIVYKLVNEKEYDLGFALVSLLKTTGIGQVEFYLTAYDCMQEISGPETALAWLKRKLPGARGKGPSTFFYYKKKKFSLLWDMVGTPSNNIHGEYEWLLRAGAYLRGAKLSEIQLNELKRYYRGKGNSYYHIIGQYLMGDVSEAVLLAQVANTKQICEMAYFVGLAHEAKNDIAQAIKWYRICLETGLKNNGEFRWATDQLYRWYAMNMSIERIKESQP